MKMISILLICLLISGCITYPTNEDHIPYCTYCSGYPYSGKFWCDHCKVWRYNLFGKTKPGYANSSRSDINRAVSNCLQSIF